MITRIGQLFHLETPNTSYLFRVLDTGHLQHIYYGKHLNIAAESDGELLSEKQAFLRGNTNAFNSAHPSLTLEDIPLEMSSLGKGDIREPFVSLTFADGSSTCSFLFDKAEITRGKPAFATLPGSYGEPDSVDHLRVCLKEEASQVVLELHYYVYSDCDVISRSARILNYGDSTVQVNRLMSLQLDLDRGDFTMTTFGGGWAREMKMTETPLRAGKHVNESLTGTSSSRANPFVMLSDPHCTEDSGSCYGFNLIYSGNHYEAAQVSSFGKLRFVSGIHPETFRWHLKPKAVLEAPEAFMTFSAHGKNGMSHHMHRFIREHIVRGAWQHKRRPVLVNSWEAMYFNISEDRLVSLAKAGAALGAELFVLDDGWFGVRNDDRHSLGDWVENRKKLPGGLAGLSKKIHELGMDFGIWVEPEMVNPDSDLYRAHPDWAMDIPGRSHSEGRNQRILDLTRIEVQDYVIESMSRVFESADISYVKWDMNRTFTDYYSRALPPERQGEVSHRYYCGLYRIMKELTERFPHILFEGCSAGGNRFDPGILCYFPQIWASDNTDALCRSEIQNNYTYGYPLSVMGCHVSACPNHQTLRNVPLQTRFHVAAFGLLGYECNLMELSDTEKQEIREEIALYKNYGELFQFGTFYRSRSFRDQGDSVIDPSDADVMEWTAVSEDQSKAVGMLLQKLAVPNSPSQIYAPKGLSEEKCYHFYNRKVPVNIMDYGGLINTVSPIHIKNGSLVHQLVAKAVKFGGETEDYITSGDVLMAGVRLHPAYSATGLSEDVRHFPDFASRMYLMEEVRK